jgi:hypothetical protein
VSSAFRWRRHDTNDIVGETRGMNVTPHMSRRTPARAAVRSMNAAWRQNGRNVTKYPASRTGNGKVGVAFMAYKLPPDAKLMSPAVESV